MLNLLINLLFPKTCDACGTVLQNKTTILCVSCRHELPLTNYHNTNNKHIEKLFYGRVKLVTGTALFHFIKQGKVQKLIHDLKYRKKEYLSAFFGKWLGAELANNNLFSTIDAVVYVPLHPNKLKKRGFNQVEGFATQIASSLNVPVLRNVLVKKTSTKSQVKLNRLQRWRVKDGLFYCSNPELIEGKHILLVDDIITTGATIESCVLQLNKAKNVKVSVAVIAIA